MDQSLAVGYYSAEWQQGDVSI